MIVAFTLGLMGSFGHCAGMCSGVIVLLGRHPALHAARFGWVWVHLGRLASYALLGLVAGAAGHLIAGQIATLQWVQGALALLMASMALYFVLAILGRLPSPDAGLGGLTRAWGQAMRNSAGAGHRPLAPLGLGLLWGLLPCGLVLTALFTAAVSTSPLAGALRMAVFGVGTLPSLLAVRWLARRPWAATWPRYGAAAVMLLFGVQFALRGLASWGVVDHLMLGGFMLW